MRFVRLALVSVLAAFASLALASPARAQSCMTLQFEFQPDCYRPDESSACVQTVSHMDLGPQIAVWLQSSSGAFVDTLMVTNATAVRGIGNRPGRWDFLSGPLFPYGKRVMVLPIWAHARGKTYRTVIMSEPDGTCAVGGPAEYCLGWHESYSSPEFYYCRPLMQGEAMGDLGVDAITCPSRFNSEKGKFDPTAVSYYPPRSDITSFTSFDPADTQTYASINDLDAVAAATPGYGSIYQGLWSVPGTLAPGDYTLFVEVNKEYDSNASNMHMAFVDQNLSTYGTQGNFGQPSVVYQVPLHIDVTTGAMDAEATSQIAGYGDWTGATGTMNPPDATISTGVPGSGEGRLLQISDAAGTHSGRVLASVGPCGSMTCDPNNNTCSTCQPGQPGCTQVQCVPPPAPPDPISGLTVAPDQTSKGNTTFTFLNADANGQPVTRYDIRSLTGSTITDQQFMNAAPAKVVTPGPPGTPATFSIPGLKPSTDYVVAVQAFDACGQHSTTVSLSFTTPSAGFTKLSGCFVATAAWGSALAPDVAAMRQVRDRLRPASTMFAVATDLYYSTGPAAAEVLKRSDTARALVRRLLGPVGAASQAAVALARTR